MTHPQEKIIGILGGGGFLGRYVVNLFASQGYLLKVGGRHPEKYLHLKIASSPGRIQLHKVDVRNTDSLSNFIDGCHGIVNLVGILFEKGDQCFEALHTKAAETIASLCTQTGVQHMISVSALGAHAKSTSHYATTKALGEGTTLKHFPTATILRPSLLFGPEDHFFNRFAAMMRLSPIIPIFKGGHTKFQPVYVMDVARAVVACMNVVLQQKNQDLSVQGKTFDLGGPDIFTFEELLEKIMDVIQRPRVLVHFPLLFGYFLSMISKAFPTPFLTVDQLRLLENDSICSKKAPGLQELKVCPTALDVILPTYLHRFSKIPS